MRCASPPPRSWPAPGEGVSGEAAVEVLDGERVAGGGDVELDVAVGAEPHRAVEASLGAVRADDVVMGQFDRTAVDLVAVAFLFMAVEERFAVGEAYRRALAAAEDQFRIGIGQEGLVEQDRAGGAGGNLQRVTARDEVAHPGESFAAADLRDAQRGLLHQRNLARHERPLVTAVDRMAERDAFTLGTHGVPRTVVVTGLFPSPRIAVAVDLFEESDVGNRGRGDRFVAENLPFARGVDGRFGLGVTLHEQAAHERYLRLRFQLAAVPHLHRKRVAARMQQRCDVYRLVVPAAQVAARRTPAGRGAVHEEAVAVVGRDVDDERFGPCGQVEAAPEMVDAEVIGRRFPVAGPAGFPCGRQQAGVGSRGADGGKRGDRPGVAYGGFRFRRPGGADDGGRRGGCTDFRGRGAPAEQQAEAGKREGRFHRYGSF